MSRSGFTTSNYLGMSSAIVSGPPISISAWCWTSIATTQQAIFFLNNSSNNTNYLGLDVLNNNVTMQASSGAVQKAITTTTYSTSTWFHACGVSSASNSRAAYLNGGGKGTNSTSQTPASLARTTIGMFRGSSSLVPWAPAGTGYLAEVAVWNVALSDADVASLALGVSPFMVHPESIVAYWPLIGAYSPEINLVSNSTTMTITGSLSAATHPAIFNPRGARRLKAGSTPAAASAVVMHPFRTTLGTRTGSRQLARSAA